MFEDSKLACLEFAYKEVKTFINDVNTCSPQEALARTKSERTKRINWRNHIAKADRTGRTSPMIERARKNINKGRPRRYHI